MADDWVQVFDASGSWPHDPQAVWDAGFRVIAGYVNQGSWKSFTPVLRDRWITAAHPFGFAPMYEAAGDEPSTNPTAGTAHGRAARAGMRVLFGAGSDHVAIAYAMDRDTTPGNTNVRHYYSLVQIADTVAPIGYIESDAGLPLVTAGILAGVFEPAAYAWDNRTSVMTPATAPDHVLWTQEHNGVTVAGSGDVDTGHIRTAAPILWPATQGDDMALTDDDVTKIVQGVWNLDAEAGASAGDVIPNDSPYVVDSPNHTPAGTNPTTGAGYALGRIRTLVEKMAVVLDPTALAAAVIAALPKGTGAPLTEADVEAAVHTAVSTLTLTGTLAAAQ